MTQSPRAHTYTVALAAPAAPPTITFAPRCARCGKLLAHYLAHPYSTECARCGQVNQEGVPPPPPVAPDARAQHDTADTADTADIADTPWRDAP